MWISNIRLTLVLCNENPYTDVYEDFHYSVQCIPKRFDRERTTYVRNGKSRCRCNGW